jgi:hypothetical protein
MQPELRDIQDLDPIGWWPLAPGWLVLIALGLLALVLLLLLIRRLVLFPPGSWRGEARKQLANLQRELKAGDCKGVAAGLSELLRRVVILQLGRSGNASLTDRQWLYCLTSLDSKGYDWETHGGLLLTLPYAPAGENQHREQLNHLLRAATSLVAHCGQHRWGRIRPPGRGGEQ